MFYGSVTASPLNPALASESLMMQSPQTDIGLQIVVVDGANAVNALRKKTAITVEVEDRNNQPVEGANVTFTAPLDGPTVAFAGGSQSFTVATDSNGKASASGTAGSFEGAFEYKVTAMYYGQTVNTTVKQTNSANAPANAQRTAAAAPESTPHKSRKTVIILVAVAAAAAVGLGAGLAGHKGSSNSGSQSGTTIGEGSGGTVGAPH